MDSAAGGGKDEDSRAGDGKVAIIFGDGFGGSADPEGDGVVREIEVTVAQIELDRRAADCDGLRRGYGLTPWGLEGFCDEDLRDECGGCGETKSCAKEMTAGEQQVLRSASMRAVFHDWTLAEVCASRKFGSRVWEQKCRYFLGVRW